MVATSEERRLKNIRQNEALLAELDLKGAADGLGLPASRPSGAGAKGKGKAGSSSGEKKARPVQPRKRARDDMAKVKRDAPVTRRQSTRLAATTVDPDETPAQKKARLVSHSHNQSHWQHLADDSAVSLF